MGELASTMDALAADDLHALFAPQLLERLAELLRASNRLAAEITRTVRQCELTDAAEGDGLSVARHADGTLGISGQLDAVGGEKLQAAIEAIVQAARPKGDLRTRIQQQADALVQLADNALAAGNLPFCRTVKPHV